MKIFTVIAVVCYLFVATNAFPTSPVSPPTGDLVQQCSTETHVDFALARKLVRHNVVASNENEKCLLSCYLKGKGYYVDGKVDFDKMLESHKRFIPETDHHDLEQVFKRCSETMDYTKNSCEVAYDAYQCAYTKKH